MAPSIRRVITGEKNGKSVFAHVETVPALRRAVGRSFYRIWGADGLTTVPNDGETPFSPTSFPQPGGVRVHAIEYATAGDAEAQRSGGLSEEEFQRLVPRGLPRREWDPATGVHATDSIEIITLIAGELTLVQDDGAEVSLRVGDVVVQNGVRHTWRQNGDQPCTMIVVCLGAPFGSELTEAT